MKRALMVLILIAAAGCSGGASKKDPGEQRIGSRYSITTSTAWSHVSGNPQNWTIDGPGLGLLQTWGGLGTGDALIRKQGRRMPQFRSSFGPLEVAEMVADTIEIIIPGADVETADFRPVAFGSRDGFRFQINYVRKGLPMRGTAAGSIHRGRLDLILFTAPAEHYFDLRTGEIDRIIASVKTPA